MKIDELLVNVWQEQKERFIIEYEYFSNFNHYASNTRLGKSKIIIDFGRFN